MEPNTNIPDNSGQPSPDNVQPFSQPAASPLPQPNIITPANPVVQPGPAGPAWNTPPVAPPAQPQVVVSPDPGPPVPVVGGEPMPPAGVGTVVSGGFTPPPPTGPQPASQLFAASPAPVYGAPDGGVAPMPAPSRSRLLKPLLIALAAVVVIGGGSAAAYFGAIVPNKPANVLKSAVVNTLQQTQVSSKGTLEASSGAGGLALKADINTATNSVAKTADVQLNLTVSGVTFPIEARLVNKNVYVKVGDLSSIAGLVGAYNTDAGSVATAVSSQLSNKWIVIDETLLNEAGIGCVLNTNWTLSQADIKLLENQYSQNPAVTIQSTSSDSVNGQKAEKFVLSIDDDKAAAAFGNAKTFNNLSMVKSLEKCYKNSSSLSGTSTTVKGDHDKTPITLWVDKGSKRIVKAELQTSAKEKKAGTSGSFTTTISYKPVSISAPSNAEPAIQVFTDIQKSISSNPALSGLLGGGTDSTSTDSTSLTQ
jgi:hypothetical protein